MEQWPNARIVCDYSCGAAPDSHRLPKDTRLAEYRVFNKGILQPQARSVKKKFGMPRFPNPLDKRVPVC
jgi:hypothetical protein